MWKRCLWPVLLVSTPGLAAPEHTGRVSQDNLSAADLFALADRARGADRLADAETIYEALSHDPDAEIRAEARFRKGMMLADQRRYTDAAIAFRALLDEKPDAPRVRLELARVLALMGDEGGARKQLRQAQAAGLPPDVALVVDQFANALRSTRTVGGSIEIALAPDSNINRATDARTLDTIIAPLDLSSDARARSGVGAKLSGQGYARLRIGDRLSLLPRISGRGELYRASQFNDVSASAQLGLEWNLDKDRLQPAVGHSWRWYGGDLYARTRSASLNWLHMAGRRAQFSTDASISRVRYALNGLQSGMIYDLGSSYERVFTQKSGGSLSLSVTRQTARDRGYSNVAGGITALYWRDLGKLTLFGSVGLRRLEADARLFPFTATRREWLASGTIGATFRQATVAGFAPVLRLRLERNASTVAIYDYKRQAVEFGITRAF